jgi:hypothetical protein
VTPSVPLCVDLDGILVRTDLLHEQVLRLIRQKPSALLALPGWLLRGKATMTQELAKLVRLDLDTLPLNEPLVAYLAEEQAKGREPALLSAAAETVVQAFARRLGLFARAKSSDGRLDLVGPGSSSPSARATMAASPTPAAPAWTCRSGPRARRP